MSTPSENRNGSLEPQVDVDPATEELPGEMPTDQPIVPEGPEHMHVVEGEGDGLFGMR